jgi:hypothetical protein
MHGMHARFHLHACPPAGRSRGGPAWEELWFVWKECPCAPCPDEHKAFCACSTFFLTSTRQFMHAKIIVFLSRWITSSTSCGGARIKKLDGVSTLKNNRPQAGEWESSRTLLVPTYMHAYRSRGVRADRICIRLVFKPCTSANLNQLRRQSLICFWVGSVVVNPLYSLDIYTWAVISSLEMINSLLHMV